MKPWYCYIYTLTDPIDNQIKYVGKTVDPNQRLSSHRSEARKGRGGKRGEWIRSLIEIGREPIMKIVARVWLEDWEKAEIAYIESYKKKGCPLFNLNKGGGYDLTGIKHGLDRSPQWRKHLSEARKGIKYSYEVRKKISEHNGGSKLKPEQVRRIRELIGMRVRKEDIAKEYNVNVSSIYHIAQGKTYRFIE